MGALQRKWNHCEELSRGGELHSAINLLPKSGVFVLSRVIHRVPQNPVKDEKGDLFIIIHICDASTHDMPSAGESKDENDDQATISQLRISKKR